MAVLCAVCVSGVAAPLRVVIEVDDAGLRDNVEASLAVRAAIDKDETDRDLLLRLHARAEGEIRRAAQALGYYDPAIEVSLNRGQDPWLARYRVRAGPRTRLQSVSVALQGDGDDDAVLRALIRDQQPRQGEPLHHGRYEAFKAELLREANDRGFLDAQYHRRQLRVDPELHEAHVDLLLDTGPRYRFGPLSIDQTVLSDAVIGRYLRIAEGEPFSTGELVEARFRFADLGYYRSVQVSAEKEQAVDHAIPVAFEMEPVPSQKYRVGVGYGTDTGARMTLGADWRYLNDAGHRLSTDIRLSEIKQALAANYRIPIGHKPNEEIGVQATSLDETVADIETRRIGAGVSLTRQPGDWQRRLYLRHEREQFSGADSGSSKLTMPGVSFDRTRIDDPVRARLGWAVFIDVHGAARNVLSDTGFLQARGNVRGVLPVFSRSRLLLRAEAGGTLLEEFSELPPSQRFFAGGDQSVRGYGYQSIGPTNADGEVIGGAFLSTVSAELEMPIIGPWGAALFIDAGGVDDDPNPPLRRGVGAGMRYLSPVGAVQVDLAHPLDGDRRGVRLHLGIRVGL